MTGDLYRDAHVGLRARLGELAGRIEDREAEVTEAFWETIPTEERRRLGELLRGFDLVSADVFEELVRAEGMLASYLDELEGLIARLPAIEADWAEVPDEVTPPPPPPESWSMRLLNRGAARGIVRSFEAMVWERDRQAVFQKEEGITCLARFREGGCPLALRATVLTSANEEVGEVAMSLVTSIARALPPLVVRHESLVLTLGKALGIKHEVEVGEPSFDGLFLIEGTQEAADLFLLPNVRSQLLTLARFDVPTLTVDPPARVASLRWRFEPASRALDAAVRVLTSIRETSPSLKFRRE
jgi:hypothetical protein